MVHGHLSTSETELAKLPKSHFYLITRIALNKKGRTNSFPFNLIFSSTCAFSSEDSVPKQNCGPDSWNTNGHQFGVMLFLLMVLNWANDFGQEMRKKRILTWLKQWEENVFHIFQGGTGKQKLATDENKMWGNEEIRNTKELELIKSVIKALL